MKHAPEPHRRITPAGVCLALVGLAVVSLVAGCGGAPPIDGDAVFREIQAHEAVIEHRLALTERCAEGAPCPPADEAGAAAEAICALAERLDDVDARARCALARRRVPRRGA